MPHPLVARQPHSAGKNRQFLKSGHYRPALTIDKPTNPIMVEADFN